MEKNGLIHYKRTHTIAVSCFSTSFGTRLQQLWLKLTHNNHVRIYFVSRQTHSWVVQVGMWHKYNTLIWYWYWRVHDYLFDVVICYLDLLFSQFVSHRVDESLPNGIELNNCSYCYINRRGNCWRVLAWYTNVGIVWRDTYSYCMCIFCGVVFTSILVIIFMGPERFHTNLKIHDHNNEIQHASDE